MKLKQILISFTIVSAIAIPTVVIASCNSGDVSYTSIDEFNYNLDIINNELTITGFKTNHDERIINIPESYIINGVTYKVVCIDNHAFFRGHFTSVTLPSTIKRIEKFAFAEQNCLPSLVTKQNDDTNPNTRNEWVVNFDLSRCNDLEYIGDYAFHYDTVDIFRMPTNNTKLKTLGEDSFCGVRLWQNWDLSGFKALEQIGEWDFYGVQSGKFNDGSLSVTIPSNVDSMRPAAFTWSDVDNVYWNIQSPPNADVPKPNTLGFAPEGASFVLSDIKEFHVQKGADVEQWETFFDDNSSFTITIPFFDIDVPIIDKAYRVDKFIADINPDGSIDHNVTDYASFGLNNFNDEIIKDAIDTILAIPLSTTGYTLEDIAKLIPEIDDYIASGCTHAEDEQAIIMYDLLYLIVGGNDDNQAWINPMLQCELYLLWDRYFKLNQDAN